MTGRVRYRQSLRFDGRIVALHLAAASTGKVCIATVIVFVIVIDFVNQAVERSSGNGCNCNCNHAIAT